MMNHHTTWRKSSFSVANTNCVELAATGSPAVRDSKAPNAGHIAYAPAELAALIYAATAGRLDHLAG